MTLPPFELHRARSVEEATELRDRLGDEAAFYWGGTELILLLKLGFAAFGHLIDLKGVGELRRLELADGALVVGAGVTHAELERSALVRERLPELAALERRVGNARVRTAGTLGGNLCFADPHSDPATFLLALDGEVECRRGGAPPRRLPVGELVVGPYQTALEPGEVLTAVRVPLPAATTRVKHAKLAFRERPAVTVTCALATDGARVAEARVAVGAVGPTPVRARAAERLLIGLDLSRADDGALAEAGAAAAEAAGATGDANGSPEYKRNLVAVLVRRALRDLVDATS